jgi:hypothetical protein
MFMPWGHCGECQQRRNGEQQLKKEWRVKFVENEKDLRFEIIPDDHPEYLIQVMIIRAFIAIILESLPAHLL